LDVLDHLARAASIGRHDVSFVHSANLLKL